jgi:hypothetical protein
MFFHFMYASLIYNCERELPLTRDAVDELPFSEAIVFPSMPEPGGEFLRNIVVVGQVDTTDLERLEVLRSRNRGLRKA